MDRLTITGNAPGMEPALVDVTAATTAVIGAVVSRQELVNPGSPPCPGSP